MVNQENTEKLKQTSDANRIGPPYSAITLDTNIYERYRFNFHGPLLQGIKRLPVDYIVSEIVYLETERRIRNKHQESKNTLESARNLTKRFNLLEAEQQNFLDHALQIVSARNPADRLIDYISNYTNDLIDAKGCDIKKLVISYFNQSPPFSESKKKTEFPDAIALESLETWAINNDKKILAISDDVDWLFFSEKSKYIDVISDLEIGLLQVQPNINVRQLEDKIHELIVRLNASGDPFMQNRIDHIINEEMKHRSAEVDMAKTYSLYNLWIVGNVTEIQYINNSLVFSDNEDILDLDVENYTATSTIFSVSAEISVSAEAIFDHSMEELESSSFMGKSIEVIEDQTITIRLVVTLRDDIMQPKYTLDITDIEILDTLEIPFGKIGLPDGYSI